MTRLNVLLLPALAASCRLDTFFRGSGGGAPPVAGPPADLRFVDQPQSARARNTLPPVRVAVRDDQGNVVAGFGGVVSLALDSTSGGGSLRDFTPVAAGDGSATPRPSRRRTASPLSVPCGSTGPGPAIRSSRPRLGRRSRRCGVGRSPSS